jgi:type IV pilus assembly protein PilE
MFSNEAYRKKIKGIHPYRAFGGACDNRNFSAAGPAQPHALISRAKSTEAQLQLEHVHTLEKTYFYLHSRYTNNLQEIGFEQAKLVTQGGNANYQIDVTESTSNTFKAKATAVADFDGDGTMNVWEIDQDKNLKEVIPD